MPARPGLGWGGGGVGGFGGGSGPEGIPRREDQRNVSLLTVSVRCSAAHLINCRCKCIRHSGSTDHHRLSPRVPRDHGRRGETFVSRSPAGTEGGRRRSRAPCCRRLGFYQRRVCASATARPVLHPTSVCKEPSVARCQ